MRELSTSLVNVVADAFSEVSRGFGFIRFSSLEESKAFVERNYPNIYLYGNSTSDNDDQAAKVRIAFSRERDDRSRGDKADGEWTCKNVSLEVYGNTTIALKIIQCAFVNFPGRTKCHRCQTPQIGMHSLSHELKAC